MTVQELIDLVAAQPFAVVLVLVALVAAAYAVGRIHGPGGGTVPPWRYVYAVLVYAACVPGVFAALLTLYTILFLRTSLLDVNVVVYFAPVLAMIAMLAIIRRSVDLDGIPGFDRLSGLIVLLALSFATVFVLSRLFVGVFFFGSLAALAAIAVFVFALFRWGAGMAFRERASPKPPLPRL